MWLSLWRLGYFSVCVWAYPTSDTEVTHCYLYIRIQTPWCMYACTVKSICFDGNPESGFLKNTKSCFFIIIGVAFSLVYVRVAGSHLLSSVPSHLLYNKRGISATEETLLICLFSTDCWCHLPCYFLSLQMHFHFCIRSIHPVFYYNFWYDILEESLSSLRKSILLQVLGILSEKMK